MNSINFFHESGHVTQKSNYIKIFYESRLIFLKSTKQAKAAMPLLVFNEESSIKSEVS